MAGPPTTARSVQLHLTRPDKQSLRDDAQELSPVWWLDSLLSMCTPELKPAARRRPLQPVASNAKELSSVSRAARHRR